MKLNAKIGSMVTALALTACGGGSNSTSSPAANLPIAPAVTSPTAITPAPTTPISQEPTPPVTPTVTPATTTPVTPTTPAPVAAVAANPVDPYTGQPASGRLTTMVSGVVVSDVTVGATITAYALQADGSNGGVLGVSPITGADGKFSMQLTSAPTGMVRFVARDGSFTSEADGSKQINTTTELVTPYITSDLNFFVITPATHIVSHLVLYKAKAGADLATAYLDGFGFVRNLTEMNAVLKGDYLYGINLLKTVPGTVQDTNNTYQDVLTAFEWFGVRYDLPSNVVVRIFSSIGENGRTLDGIDGSGTPINVGKWVNGSFDEKQVLTLDELTAVRKPDGTIQRGANGSIVHDWSPLVLQSNLTQYFYRAAACVDNSALPALVLRYRDDSFLFNSANTKTPACDTATKEIAALKAKVATNNRSK